MRYRQAWLLEAQDVIRPGGRAQRAHHVALPMRRWRLDGRDAQIRLADAVSALGGRSSIEMGIDRDRDDTEAESATRG
jgi:hypothetical protein